jgi:hypothetical protein
MQSSKHLLPRYCANTGVEGKPLSQVPKPTNAEFAELCVGHDSNT